MDFFSDDLRRDPFPMYDLLRASTPVLQMPGTDMWMVLDYEGVKRALNDHECFSSRVVPPTGKAPDWLVFEDPPRHTQLRNVILRAFTPKSIAALEPNVRRISRELLDAVLARGEMDLVADYAAPLPMMVIAEMIGIPRAEHARFTRWSEQILGLSYAISGGDEAQQKFAEYGHARDEMRAYLRELAAERRRDPKDDLLTRMIEVELPEEDVLGFFQLLLAAGTETTTNVIDNAILELLAHPDQLARLRADATLMPRAIEEVIRHRSPAQIMFRQTRRDVEVQGQIIPQGKLVLVGIGSANRDPSHFDHPERFDVGRDPNPHVAFGHGIHFCIGASLARLEARVALGDLLALPNLSRASDEPWEPRKALNVHGPARLPVRWS